MKFHRPTKIVFTVFAALVFAALVFIWIEYPKLAAGQVSLPASQASNGKTCSPDLNNCQGNPELCMELNKNQVCN